MTAAAFEGVRLVLTDIEGTTTPIRFVHEVLFGFARARLPALLEDRADAPEVRAAVERVRALAPGRPVIDALRDWMDADAKVEPLKTLQGIVWRAGYADGTLAGDLHDDVAPALRAWRAEGVRLAVYSSGSEAAQRALFGYSRAGDLAPWFERFFDTGIGGKRERGSYLAIARALALEPGAVLFLSDVAAELDAARAAGMATCQLVRDADGTLAAGTHPVAASFDAIALRTPAPAGAAR